MNILERGKPPECVIYQGEARTAMGRFLAAQVLEDFAGGIMLEGDSFRDPKLNETDVRSLLSQGTERALAERSGRLQLIPTDMHVLGAARRKAAEAKSALREKDTAEGRQILTIYTRAVYLLEEITGS